MDELPEADLLRAIDAFCARTGMSPSGVGLAALNDRALVNNLRKGRELRRLTRRRLVDFMAEWKPSEAAE